MNDELLFDEANRSLHAALTALAENDWPKMREEAARAKAIGDRWEQQARVVPCQTCGFAPEPNTGTLRRTDGAAEHPCEPCLWSVGEEVA